MQLNLEVPKVYQPVFSDFNDNYCKRNLWYSPRTSWKSSGLGRIMLLYYLLYPEYDVCIGLDSLTNAGEGVLSEFLSYLESEDLNSNNEWLLANKSISKKGHRNQIRVYSVQTNERNNVNTTKDFIDKPKRWDYIVKQDTVEIYQGYPKLCNHAIELYDPTIALMDLHCDNIAFTYELHDVNLNYKTTYEQKETIGNSEKAFLAKDTYQKSQDSGDIYKIAFSRPLEGVRDNRQGTDINTGALVTASSYYTEARHAIEYYVDKVYMGNINNFLYAPNHLIREAGRNYAPFKNSYRYRWDVESLQSIQNLHFRLDAKEQHTIEFTVPKLVCELCNGEEWVELFEMPTKTIITRVTCINGIEQKGTEKEIYSSIFIPNFV